MFGQRSMAASRVAASIFLMLESATMFDMDLNLCARCLLYGKQNPCHIFITINFNSLIKILIRIVLNCRVLSCVANNSCSGDCREDDTTLRQFRTKVGYWV